jgi:signal transduction histidine kinase
MLSFLALYHTALLGVTILLATVAGALLIGGSRAARRPSFLGTFCWLAALAYAIFLLRGHVPDLLVIALGNALLLLAWSLFWAGTRLLRGAPVGAWMLCVAPLLWLAACCIPAFQASLPVRVIAVSAAVGVLSWAGTAESFALRERHPTRLASYVLAMLTFIYGGVMFWRSGLALIWPDSIYLIEDLTAVLATVIFGAIGFAGLAVAASQAAAIDAAAWLAEAKRAEAMHDEFDRILAQAPVGVFRGRVMPDGSFTRTYLHRGIEALTGWNWEELNPPGGLAGILEPAMQDQAANMRELLDTGRITVKPRMRRRDGTWMWARVTLLVLDRHPDGSANIVGFIADHSVEPEQEMRLLHAARMEALGQLASGIAHDFNNVLQALDSSLTLASAHLPHDPRSVRQCLDLAIEAIRRGSSVTGRLLAFSRQDAPRTDPIATEPLLSGLVEFLRPAIGRDIALRVEAAPDLPPLLADRGELKTVLINLVNNARDAMPNGGSVTLAAEAACVPETAGAPPRLAAGRYVRLSVIDNGDGMSPEVLARVCEPFFTTKPAGKGTGLGLAMARGFADQSGGGLIIESQPGAGTTISIWLPQAEGQDAAADIRRTQDNGRSVRADDSAD